MRPHLRCAPGTMLLMAACAAMAAGCAATHTTTTGQVTEASQAAGSPAPRERAVADAAAILRAFGQTAIRADAQVSWQPPRPAAERVPTAARVVTTAELRSLDPHARRPPAPVTITGPAVVRRLAALVDSLQLSTIGPSVVGDC